MKGEGSLSHTVKVLLNYYYVCILKILSDTQTSSLLPNYESENRKGC